MGQSWRDVNDFCILAISTRFDSGLAHNHQWHIGVIRVGRAMRGAAIAVAEMPKRFRHYDDVAGNLRMPGAPH